MRATGPKPTDEPRGRRTMVWLVTGAVAGVVLAAVGVLGPADDEALAPGVIARVNDVAIRAEAYERAVAALAADKRNPLTEADRAHVLDRLIDEELLIQRGVEIGLVRSDRGVRAAIATAMIDSILAETSSAAPSDQELRAFYADNRGYFARPPRMRLQRIYFASGDDAPERARRAHAALVRGEDFATVRARLGDEEIGPVPDALLPPAKLRDYVGPDLVQVAQQLGPGEFSEPVRTPSGRYIVRLVDFEAPQAVPFDSLRDQVESEYRRRQGDRALRESLDWLREEADLQLARGAPR